MANRELISVFLTILGACFYFAGTIGVLRFPDVYTRLHSLIKTDNLGLGLVIIGLSLQTNDMSVLMKLALIWIFAMISSGTSCYLIAQAALKRGIPFWKK